MPTQREFRPLLPEPDPSTVPGLACALSGGFPRQVQPDTTCYAIRRRHSRFEAPCLGEGAAGLANAAGEASQRFGTDSQTVVIRVTNL